MDVGDSSWLKDTNSPTRRDFLALKVRQVVKIKISQMKQIECFLLSLSFVLLHLFSFLKAQGISFFLFLF